MITPAIKVTMDATLKFGGIFCYFCSDFMRVEHLKVSSQQLCQLLSSKLGPSVVLRHQTQINSKILSSRELRTHKRKLLAVQDPVLSAQKKIKHHQNKTLAHKRKVDAYVAQKNKSSWMKARNVE